MGLKRVGSGRCLALLPGEFRSKAPEQPHSAAAVSDQPRWPSPAEKGGGGSAARRPQETTRARGSGPAPALRLSSSHGSPPAAAGPGQEVPPPERRPRCHWLRSPSVPRGGTSCRGGPSRGGGTSRPRAEPQARAVGGLPAPAEVLSPYRSPALHHCPHSLCPLTPPRDQVFGAAAALSTCRPRAGKRRGCCGFREEADAAWVPQGGGDPFLGAR